MDRVSRAFYELKFETTFLKKRGGEFQDFFADIMEKAHPGDFMRVRPWGKVGDRKNDGYLKSERTLFQVYAPNEMTATEAVSKIDEDFKGALPYWKAHFDRWIFVHNSPSGLGPQVTKKLLELDQANQLEVTHWGQEELRRKMFRLEVTDLAALLGPAPTKRDVLDLGLEALAPVLDQIARLPAPPLPDLRPPPADKIDRNMLSEHVRTLLVAGMTRVDLVRKYFRLRPTNRDSIAESFRQHYQGLRDRGLTPDDIFWELQRYAGGDEQRPAQQSAVFASLAFFFEECDIFERKEDTTP